MYEVAQLQRLVCREFRDAGQIRIHERGGRKLYEDSMAYLYEFDYKTIKFVVIILTCLIQPFGKHILLHFLEVVTLAATWMTLWAGTVFNTHPRCEDGKGGELGWCNALSIFIGALNIVAVVAAVAGFIYYKQQDKCNACGKKIV